MTNAKLDTLLQEFLIHKDPSALQGYMADLLVSVDSIHTSKEVDSGEPNSLPINTSIFDCDPVESLLVLEDADSEETIRLPPSEIVDVSQDLYPKERLGQNQSIDKDVIEEEVASKGTDSEQTGCVSKMFVEEIAFPEPEGGSKLILDESSLIGPYHRQKLLGQGGMGMVWQVRDPMLQRTVALKILHKAFTEDPSTQMYFDEEAQINAQLQHPGILPVYSYARTDAEIPYLTMKEVRGTTMKEIIQELHIMPRGSTTSDGWNIRRLVTAFQSVCETMAYAHSKGVIHRDLKPSNIMVGKFGEVLVVDWGIAKVMKMQKSSQEDEPVVVTNRSQSGKAEEAGLVLGTPAYMSPEQASGYVYAIDNRSDIYSLGVILYQILTGETYHKGSVEEILEQKSTGKRYTQMEFTNTDDDETKHFSEQISLSDMGSDITTPFTQSFLPPKFIGRSLPQFLVQICEKSMQFNIEDRYDDALDMASDIRSWLDGAERKEKALKILSQVQEIERQQTFLLNERFEVWSKAEDQMSMEGVESDEAWQFWTESLALHEQIEENRQEMHHLLQGALIYDPELTQTHQKLVAFEYEDYLKALLDVDLKRQQKIRRRMRIYLESLPHEEAHYWNERQQKDHKATTLLRKKRGGFVGRRIQINQINAGLSEHKLVTLVGTAGVGKTHLVLEVSNQWRNVDGQESLFCDLTTATDLLGIEQELSKALSIILAPKDPWEQIGKALNQRGKTLLIFDNVEQVIESANDAVQKLLTLCTDLSLIVTSRLKLGRGDEEIIRLEPMSILEGVELFLQRAQQAYSGFTLTEQNRNIVGQIVNKLDRLPLAIELAAARASTLQVTEILSRLSERFSLLQGRMRDTDKPALLGALDWSWDLLSEEVQHAFVQCSVFRNGFDLSAAEAIIDVSNFDNPPSVMDMIEALYDDNLINKERQSDGRFRYALLASIQEYTSHKFTELRNNGMSIDGAPQRHAWYYGDLFHENQEDSSLLNLLGTELDNVMIGVEKGEPADSYRCCTTALSHFSAKGPILRGIELADVFLSRNDVGTTHYMSVQMSKVRFLRISGQMKEARKEIQRSQKRATKRVIPTQANTSKQIGAPVQAGESVRKLSLTSVSSIQDASLERKTVHSKDAVLIEGEVSSDTTVSQNKSESISEHGKQDVILQAQVWIEQGDIHETESSYEEALKAYTEAFKMYSQVQDVHGIAQVHLKFGKIHNYKGKSELAIREYTHAIDLAEQNQLFILKADALTQLGGVQRTIGEYHSALEKFQESLHVSVEIQDKFREERNLGLIGSIYQSFGELQIAISYYQKALKITIQIGHKRNQSVHLANLGLVYEHLGEYDKAIEHYQKALMISEELGNKRSIGAHLGTLGNMYQRLGLFDKSIEHCTQAIQIAREIEDKQNEGIHTSNLGNLYNGIGEYAEAIEQYTKAVKLFQMVGDKRSESGTLGNLGNVQKSLGNYEIALAHYEKALLIAREIGNKKCEGINQGNIGKLYILMNRLEEAEHHLEKSIDLCRTTITTAAGAFMGSLAFVYSKRSQTAKAKGLLREGEPLVAVFPEEHGKFLCSKAKILHQDGQRENALEALVKAQMISKNINSGKDSDLHRAIVEASDVLGVDPLLNLSDTEKKESLTLSTIEPKSIKHLTQRLIEQGDLDEAESLYDEALVSYESALKMYQEFDDQLGIASIHLKIGTAYEKQGAYDIAIESFELAYNLSKDSMPLLYIDSLISMGGISRHRGDYQKALELLNHALEKIQEQNDRFREMRTRGALAITYKNLGDSQKSITTFEETIQIAKAVGDRRAEGTYIGNLGTLYDGLGQPEIAIELYTKSIEIAIEIGDKRSESVHLSNIACVNRMLGKYEAAIATFEKAIEISTEIGDKGTKAAHFGGLAIVYIMLGEYHRALSLYTDSLSIYVALGKRKDEALAIGNIGYIYQRLEQYELAIVNYEQAIQISRDIGYSRGEGSNLGNLGVLYINMEQWDKAERTLVAAIDVCRGTFPLATGSFLGPLAGLYAQQLKIEEAKKLLLEAEPLVSVYPEEHGKFLCKRSKVFQHSNEFNLAKEALEQARAIADDLDSAPNSELRRLIETTEQQFQSTHSLQANVLHRNQELDLKRVVEENQSAQLQAERFLEQGNIDEAESLFEEALASYKEGFKIYTQIEDVRGIIQSHFNIGKVHERMGDFDIAQKQYLCAQELSQSHHLELFNADALNQLGDIERLVGNYSSALELFVQSLHIVEEIGDRVRQDISIGKIGATYKFLGQCKEAIPYFKQSLEFAKEIGNKRSEGIHLGNLAHVYKDIGELDTALSYNMQALQIARDIGDKWHEGITLGNSGNILSRLGDNQKAIVHYTQAIQIARDISDKKHEGLYLGNLGNVYREFGDHDQAIINYTAAIEIVREIGDKGAEVNFLGALGVIHSELYNYEESIMYFNLALELSKEIGDKLSEGVILGNLGDLLIQMQRWDEAEKHLLASIEITKTIFPVGVGGFSGSLAWVYAQQSKMEEAQRLLLVGEPLVKTYPLEHGKFLCKKSKILHMTGQSEKAREALEQAMSIAERINSGDDSQFGKLIVETEQFLS